MTDQAKIDAVGEKSLDDGIMGISSMAEGYAKPYISKIWLQLRRDLRRAGFDIMPIAPRAAKK